MKLLTKTALTATAAAGLYAAAICPRRGHPGWEALARWRYAHRGLHNISEGRPENSLSAFRAAVEHGLGAELDVHLTLDGALAVVHDSDLKRVTGKSATVEELTAAELAAYPLSGSDETVPLFDEVLEIFRGRAPLIVELKTHRGNFAELTDAVMERLGSYDGLYSVESFDPHAVRYLRDAYPQVIRGQLSENFLRSAPGDLSVPARVIMSELLSTFLTKPDFIAYNCVDRSNLSLRAMKRLYGVHEVSWTVRDPELLRALESEGVVPIFEGFIPE